MTLKIGQHPGCMSIPCPLGGALSTLSPPAGGDLPTLGVTDMPREYLTTSRPNSQYHIS